MSGTQLSVSQGGEAGVTALLDLSDDSEISEQEKTTTAAVFLGCVSASAKSDTRLVNRWGDESEKRPRSKNIS